MNSRTRIVTMTGSLVVALALIGGAYIFSGPSIFTKWSTANAASTDDILKAYAAKDTDGDGLPDWEEALYGTDPNNPMSFKAGVTDGDAVAQGLIKPKFSTAVATSTTPDVPGVDAGSDTLTDQFAKTLFTQYVNNRGDTAPSSNDISAFVQNGMQSLVASHATVDTYSMSDVRSTDATGADAVTAYAEAADSAFAKNTTPTTKDPLDYFNDVVTKNDQTSLKKVQDISDAYANIAAAFMKIPVPSEAQPAHLEIANALMHMHEATADFATISNDPLRAMLGLAEYKQDEINLVQSFADMDVVFRAEGVVIAPGQSGYSFFNKAEIEGAGARATPSS